MGQVSYYSVDHFQLAVNHFQKVTGRVITSVGGLQDCLEAFLLGWSLKFNAQSTVRANSPTVNILGGGGILITHSENKSLWSRGPASKWWTLSQQ